jgi:hypothetical protein
MVSEKGSTHRLGRLGSVSNRSKAEITKSKAEKLKLKQAKADMLKAEMRRSEGRGTTDDRPLTTDGGWLMVWGLRVESKS